MSPNALTEPTVAKGWQRVYRCICKVFARSTSTFASYAPKKPAQQRQMNNSLDHDHGGVEHCSGSDLFLAMLLQEEEYGIEISDTEETFSEREVVQSASDLGKEEECTESDLMLARLLQEEEDEAQIFLIPANSEEEYEEMQKSPYGKAVVAVQKVLELKEDIKTNYPRFAQHIESVSTDDMVFLARNLLEKQAEFIEKGIRADIDIGYHYTNATNLDSIRTNGLMTKNERDSQGVKPDRFNGSSYGDGVYTGNDPMSFSNFGDTGLVVGRLQGFAKNYSGRTGGENTVVLAPQNGMTVLKSSAQCLPMIKYNKTLTTSEDGKNLVAKMSSSLQEILDEVFNTEVSTTTTARTAHWSSTYASRTTRRNNKGGKQQSIQQGLLKRTPRSNQGRIQRNRIQQGVLRYNAPERLKTRVDHTSAFCRPPKSCDFQNDCAICQDTLFTQQSCVSLKSCNHVFHKDCIEEACKFSSRCPTCRKGIPKTPTGKSPSGSMTVSINTALRCGGFPNCGAITIAYSMQGGNQKHYHENPGEAHSSKRDTAYLPNNTDGQDLLKRLKYAFMHGLTFTVGTSMTTGSRNQCTWSSIHHKTSVSGGAHGFPDPNYFSNCNGELDSLDVPIAHVLDADGNKWKA